MQVLPPELALEPERLLTREEYERLVDHGCFNDQRVELLYGRIVWMTPANDGHAWAVERLTNLLVTALAGRARVRIQSPLAASDASEPEPDVVVSPPGNRPGRHPDEALWVIEVADSSLRRDRGLKARLYAEASVPEYWVVNVGKRCIEVFRAPEDGEYTERHVVPSGDVATPEAFPDLEVEVAGLFA